MENCRVGVLDRLGVTTERLHELNPRMVVLRITGLGHDGPEAQWSGLDQIAQGEGGLMSLTGLTELTKVGVPIADLLAGMNGADGVVTALYDRERTGRGRVVHTSLLTGIAGCEGGAGSSRRSPPVYRALRHVRDPHRRHSDRVGFRASMAVVPERVRHRPLGRRFATNADRVTNRRALIDLIEERLEGADDEDAVPRLVPLPRRWASTMT